MESIVENIPTSNNPNDFDFTTAAVLIGLGAEEFIDLFRKNNIGQSTLKELGEEDLIKLGINNEDVRLKIIQEASNLPIANDTALRILESDLNAIEIKQMLQETAQQFHRIHLSLLANKTALKRNKELFDTVLYYDSYGCDLAVKCISETNRILNDIDSSLEANFSVSHFNKKRNKKRKIIVGTFGAVSVAFLAALLIKSIRQLH